MGRKRRIMCCIRPNRDFTENLHSAMCSLETVVTYSGIAWEPERVDKLQVRKGLPIDTGIPVILFMVC